MVRMARQKAEAECIILSVLENHLLPIACLLDLFDQLLHSCTKMLEERILCEYVRALEWFQKALAALEKVLGMKHT